MGCIGMDWSWVVLGPIFSRWIFGSGNRAGFGCIGAGRVGLEWVGLDWSG